MILNPAAPGSNPEWGLIYYKALITAQDIPETSSLRGSTLGTRGAEHKAVAITGHASWLMVAALKAVLGHTFWHTPQKWSQLNCMQRLCDWVEGRSISVSYIYIYIHIHIHQVVLPNIHHHHTFFEFSRSPKMKTDFTRWSFMKTNLTRALILVHFIVQ